MGERELEVQKRHGEEQLKKIATVIDSRANKKNDIKKSKKIYLLLDKLHKEGIVDP